MNIEEAKEQLISLKENAKVNIDTDEIFRLDYEAITFVLNELDKNTETINNLINEVTIKDSELELKDQVIWFMANRSTTEYHDIDWVTNYYYEEAKNYLEKSKTENN